jgi:hypothetical protein
MAVTATVYGIPQKNQWNGAAVIDWDTDTIKVALCTSSYVPDQDTHDFFNDVTNEITGTGYTAGGVTLTCSAPTYDTASNEIRFDAADPSWSSASFTARIAVVYKSTGTASTSPLICWIDFGTDQTVTAGTFTIVIDSTGIWKLTCA